MEPTIITNYVSTTNFIQTTATITNMVTAYTPEVAGQAIDQSISWLLNLAATFFTLVALAIVAGGAVKFFRDRDWKAIKGELKDKDAALAKVVKDADQFSKKTTLESSNIWNAQSVAFESSRQYDLSAYAAFAELFALLAGGHPADRIKSSLERLLRIYDLCVESSPPTEGVFNKGVVSGAVNIPLKDKETIDAMNDPDLSDLFSKVIEQYQIQLT
jgi:hypothetical protein